MIEPVLELLLLQAKICYTHPVWPFHVQIFCERAPSKQTQAWILMNVNMADCPLWSIGLLWHVHELNMDWIVITAKISLAISNELLIKHIHLSSLWHAQDLSNDWMIVAAAACFLCAISCLYQWLEGEIVQQQACQSRLGLVYLQKLLIASQQQIFVLGKVLQHVETLKCYLINYPYLSDYGRQYFVFLFHRGTEQLHQGDMNNSTSPNMFLIHKK